jgi:GNAT superfamily N-acetyltransferase
MNPTNPPLFSAGKLRCFELQEEDIPELQRFFEANPEYFLAVEGKSPGPDEGCEMFHDKPPAGMSFTKVWMMGIVDDANALVGMADVESDLLAPGVWHIGLIILATARHGSGEAHALYQALEDWAVRGGAQWMRLGVVEGNARAERFWEKVGFIEVCRHASVAMGTRMNTVRFMVKPLACGTFAEYLSLVPRDQPHA